ncbi:DUF1441 family protein [Pelagibius sp.]|uniref:DUF1441 family protein n=1 Tax=Pelagibius sp. TaxID=1931238 RepID=UPI00261B7315|nr:DUF1441 family protein [Pelagibius sp.]
MLSEQDTTTADLPEGPVLLNKGQLAMAFRVSLPTIDRWKHAGMPIEEPGSNGKPYRCDPDKVLAWRREEEGREQAQRAAEAERIAELHGQLDLQGGSVDGLDSLTPKQRQAYYEAEAVRMKVDRERGLLCETEAVKAQFVEVFSFLSGRLQDLPDFLERRCNLSPEAVEELAAAVTEWQRRLADDLRTEALDDGRNTAA